MEEEGSKKRELEAAMLDKVGVVISAIKSAKHVDQVICALHSIASLIFPIDPSLLSGLPYARFLDISDVPHFCFLFFPEFTLCLAGSAF